MIDGYSSILKYLVSLQGQVTLTAVLSVLHVGHEDTGTAGGGRTFSLESFDLAFTVDLVVGQHSQLVLSVLVLDLLGGGVDLLLSLLTTTSQSENQVEGRFLLDVVVGQGTAVFQLLTSKDQSLLVRRNTFLVLDLRLHVVDGVRRLHLQGDGLAGQGLDENLHVGSGKCFVQANLFFSTATEELLAMRCAQKSTHVSAVKFLGL